MSARDCFRTRRIAGLCAVCHRLLEPIAHLDLTRTSGATCGACCPHCQPTITEPAAASPDAEREPSQASTGGVGNISGNQSSEPLAPGARKNGNIFISKI